MDAAWPVDVIVQQKRDTVLGCDQPRNEMTLNRAALRRIEGVESAKRMQHLHTIYDRIAAGYVQAKRPFRSPQDSFFGARIETLAVQAEISLSRPGIDETEIELREESFESVGIIPL